MTEKPQTLETRERVSDPAPTAPRNNVWLLMPLISVLARRIATVYGPDNAGHADVGRWGYQLAFLLGVVALYFLLRI